MVQYELPSATTDIRLYLAFKIYNQFNNGTQAMLVMFYQRANANPLIPSAVLNYVHSKNGNFTSWLFLDGTLQCD